jgi:hypothetical protein
MAGQLPDQASRLARPSESIQTVIRDVVDFLRLESKLTQPGMPPEERYRITLLVNQKGLRALLAIPQPGNGKAAKWDRMHSRMRQIAHEMFDKDKAKIPAPRPIMQKRLPGANWPAYLVWVAGDSQYRVDQCYHMDLERTVKMKMEGERERSYIAALNDQERFHTEIGNALYEWGLIDWTAGYDTQASVYSDSEITSGLKDEIEARVDSESLKEIIEQSVDKAMADDDDDDTDWSHDPDDDVMGPVG